MPRVSRWQRCFRTSCVALPACDAGRMVSILEQIGVEEAAAAFDRP
jgi:hypothetical protein